MDMLHYQFIFATFVGYQQFSKYLKKFFDKNFSPGED